MHEVTLHDPLLKRRLGFKCMANFKAFIRLFNNFTQGTNEWVMAAGSVGDWINCPSVASS